MTKTFLAKILNSLRIFKANILLFSSQIANVLFTIVKSLYNFIQYAEYVLQMYCSLQH